MRTAFWSKEGLKRIQKGYNEGLKALMEVNEIAPDRLSAYHLGFVLGPLPECYGQTGYREKGAGAFAELYQSRCHDSGERTERLK